MKHIHLQSLTLFSLLLLSLLPALAQRRLPATEENKRKADYVLLEATRKQMSGKTADAYLLLDYAHRLDPMNTKVNFNRSLMRLQFTEIDSVSIDEIVRDLRYAAQNDPANKIDNMNIANIFFNLRLFQPSADIITKLLTYYPKELEYYETLSNIYQNTGDIDKAISMMDSIERKSKATEYTCLKRSLLYSIKGDTINAISVVRQQYEKAPEVLSNNIMLGIAFSNLGRPDSALYYLNRAERISPEDTRINLMKAEIYQNQNDSVNFDRETEKALLNPNLEISDKVDILVNYTRSNLSKVQSERITRLFEAVLNLHPHNAMLRQLYSSVLIYKEDYALAAEQLSYAIDADPSDPKIWLQCCWLYLRCKMLDQADAMARRGLEHFDDQPEFYNVLSYSSSLRKDYKKSIEYDFQLLELYKKLKAEDRYDDESLSIAGIYSAIGSKYTELNEQDKAREYYELSYKEGPYEPMVLNNYAYYLAVHTNEIDKAEELSARSLELDPENGSALDTYAYILFKKRNYKEALPYIEKAAEKMTEDDNNAELYEHWGDILFMLGKPDEAVEKWEKALKEAPDSELLQKKIKHKTYFYE